MLPRHLRNFTASIDGRGYAGSVDEITLPTLAITTEDHRAGGMDSAVQIDLGMETMEASIVLSDYNEDVISGFGMLGAGVPLTVRGAIQRQGDNAQGVVIKMLGSLKSRDTGTWSAGGKQSTTLVYSVKKYSETINGQEIVNIDVENMVRIIDGVDQLASQRAALGL